LGWLNVSSWLGRVMLLRYSPQNPCIKQNLLSKRWPAFWVGHRVALTLGCCISMSKSGSFVSVSLRRSGCFSCDADEATERMFFSDDMRLCFEVNSSSMLNAR
jgi:hypothetical protein